MTEFEDYCSACRTYEIATRFWVVVICPIETVSPEGTFCDTVQVPSRGGDMELI